MNVKEFWECKEELAIHCDTEEKANKLLKKFDEFGKKWINEKSYLSDNKWENYKANTCYDNENCYCYKGFYECKVIEFDELDDFKTSNTTHILDNVELEYLFGVIKPFINRVTYISKVSISKEHAYIGIRTNSFDGVALPLFPKDKMYKGMELDKEYTLKELGLIEYQALNKLAKDIKTVLVKSLNDTNKELKKENEDLRKRNDKLKKLINTLLEEDK